MDSNAFFEEVALATKQYLGDKLEVDKSKFSKANISKELDRMKISDELKVEVIQLLNDCDLALFASSYQPEMMTTYHRALSVVEEIENAITKG